MSWKEKIPGAFGVEDKKFARHANDIEDAVDMINSAWREGVGFKEYIDEIRSWLNSQGCKKEHIEKEMKRVVDISSYFRHD